MALAIFLNIMKAGVVLCLIVHLVLASHQATQLKLSEPIATPFVDDTEIIALAEKETFTLPITTRTIAHTLEMYPQPTDECWFSSEPTLYKPIASTSFIEDEDAKISTMLTLSEKEKLFLVDQEFNIFSYSLDEHFLLKKLSPKSRFAGLNKKISTMVLTATEDEQIVYIITPQKYYIFTVESLGLEISEEQELPGEVKDVQKVFIYREYLVLLSSQSDLFIYRIDKTSNKLALAQSFKFEKDLYFTDMEFEPTTQMLYLLAFTKPVIKVFHFKPSEFPNEDKTLTIFVEYDMIEYASVTNRHSEGVEEGNLHLRLEISREREQQTLMVLFLHKYHYVVAELSYQVNQQNWYFVRYFKFSMKVSEIHIIKDVMAVVGSESMGIFPFGIHPRLIDEEFNGMMTLTSMSKIKLMNNGRFVGLTKNTLEYGVIRLEQKAELNCKIEEQSKLKTVKIRANLTACSSQDREMYETYCVYEKTFALEEMQITVIAPIANLLWTGMLFFILLIILGIIILFAIQRNKEEEIKRLEQYFEDKKKKSEEGVEEPPPSSERRTFNYL